LMTLIGAMDPKGLSYSLSHKLPKCPIFMLSTATNSGEYV